MLLIMNSSTQTITNTVSLATQNRYGEITNLLNELYLLKSQHDTPEMYRTNLNSREFIIIKGKYDVMMGMWINFIIDNPVITNDIKLQFTDLQTKIQYIKDYIVYIEGIIMGRDVEFKARVKYLVERIKRNPQDTQIPTLLNTIELYNEFQF